MTHSLQYDAQQSSISWPTQHDHFSVIKQVVIILLGTIVMAVAAQISVPLQPVPLTFQSATVILIGMTCGARQGAHIMIAYLVSGALGLPVFANYHAGIAELMSPRGGYLIGFLPAVIMSGALAYRGFVKTKMSSFFSACLSDAIIFFFGVTWLASFIGWHSALSLGFMPFLASVLIKLLTLSWIMPSLWK